MRKRFTYRQPGLWVLGVRVYRREPALDADPDPEQLGCKSWVVLDAPVSTRAAGQCSTTTPGGERPPLASRSTHDQFGSP